MFRRAAVPSSALRALRALIAPASTAAQNQQPQNLQNGCCTNLCTSSANEDRQCHSPTCHEIKFEVCFLHSYLLGLLCVGYGTVHVVSGTLTQQSDGSLCLLNLLIRQADRTIGLLAPMLPLRRRPHPVYRDAGIVCLPSDSTSLSESSITSAERLQHMRDQRHGIDRFAVGLRMQRGVLG